ncbi:hypothetical protein CANARDRAFT_199136 [[Candida] arabinofermentans NRRL YB-2248]|uniref:Phosphatidic acid phosphatase type 2/haloperoxidase domain-containing protein n=1 Tax=[Candida] arabinofermentans NRRL YB-2248 TaxID=983967 RepID=A0A1E4T0M1_9ASCO|nr:hypothetical protein CANARDRAFT_199136 [[Candida] arabinofermentans NRRL YB-2248]
MRYETYLKKYITYWITAITIFGISTLMELNVTAFQRRFSLINPAINYPFTINEQFTNSKLALYAVLLPYCLMIVVLLIQFITNNINKVRLSHMINITTLSFLLSLSINAFITEFLKLRIGKLRPDFLSRCGADIDIDNINGNFDTSICTAPYGLFLLNDGFKSCPSGHSSFAWCGLNFFNFWLMGQFKIYSGGKKFGIGKFKIINLINIIPILLAFHIAISRSQDYRHDYIDISLGTIIGFTVSIFIYRQFFKSVYDEDSQLTLFEDDYKLLEENDVSLPI